MRNQHGKRPFNPKKLSEQNWNANMEEWNRRRKREIYEDGKRLIFILKAVYIALCAGMLHSIFYQKAPIDHTVNFFLFGISTMTLFTAMLFLSGHVAPGSFWGWADKQREKRARYDHRFGMKRIVISELWIVYAVISCGMLRTFAFSPLELPGKITGAVLFAIFTSLILIAVVLLSDPRSFWGQMKRFVLKDGSSHKD
jgi:hypothetical protein